ncbi:MAG: GNAT family N-acetyltransferase [Armatimonas sp.]
MTFRPTITSDALKLREIRLEALRAVPEAFGSDYETESQRPESFWEERAAGRDTGGNFIAEDANGHFVGLIGLFTDGRKKTGHVGSIVSVYVRPEARGQGVGDGLMQSCLASAREQKLARVRLAVITTNAPAIGLYIRHGFKVYGIESDVLRIGDQRYDELLMDLTL